MPDQLELTLDIKTKFQRWLASKGARLSSCSICDAKQLQLEDYLIVPTVLASPPNQQVPKYPMLQVTCRNCGNTIYFNAMVAGIVAAQKVVTEKK